MLLESQKTNRQADLLELAGIFVRLGFTAFGGPAAHLAMMEEEFVRRRKWLDHLEFVDLIGAANLVPGPSSTEVAIMIGHRRSGIAGMIVSGACFIIPAALIVTVIAWLYVTYNHLAGLQNALYGVKPVVVAIVAQAIALLVAKVVRTWPTRIAFSVTLALTLLKVNQLLLLFGAGLAFGSSALKRHHSWRELRPLILLLCAVAALSAVPLGWEFSSPGNLPANPTTIFLYFIKLGSVLYGGGYVMLSFLQADLVQHWKWLTKAQLFDAVAVGQFTPGPVFTTATFIGYLLAGWQGAIAGTVGIFLPAFVFVLISGKLLKSLRSSELTSRFMDGINAAALGLMAAVLIDMARGALIDVSTAAIAALSLFLLLKYKLNSALLILFGAGIGIAISFAHS